MHSLRGLPNVIDIRAIGLVAGVELSSRPDAVGARGYDVMVDCFNRGLVLRNSGDAAGAVAAADRRAQPHRRHRGDTQRRLEARGLKFA